MEMGTHKEPKMEKETRFHKTAQPWSFRPAADGHAVAAGVEESELANKYFHRKYRTV